MSHTYRKRDLSVRRQIADDTVALRKILDRGYSPMAHLDNCKHHVITGVQFPMSHVLSTDVKQQADSWSMWERAGMLPLSLIRRCGSLERAQQLYSTPTMLPIWVSMERAAAYVEGAVRMLEAVDTIRARAGGRTKAFGDDGTIMFWHFGMDTVPPAFLQEMSYTLGVDGGGPLPTDMTHHRRIPWRTLRAGLVGFPVDEPRATALHVTGVLARMVGTAITEDSSSAGSPLYDFCQGVRLRGESYVTQLMSLVSGNDYMGIPSHAWQPDPNSTDNYLCTETGIATLAAAMRARGVPDTGHGPLSAAKREHLGEAFNYAVREGGIEGFGEYNAVYFCKLLEEHLDARRASGGSDSPQATRYSLNAGRLNQAYAGISTIEFLRQLHAGERMFGEELEERACAAENECRRMMHDPEAKRIGIIREQTGQGYVAGLRRLRAAAGRVLEGYRQLFQRDYARLVRDAARHQAGDRRYLYELLYEEGEGFRSDLAISRKMSSRISHQASVNVGTMANHSDAKLQRRSLKHLSAKRLGGREAATQPFPLAIKGSEGWRGSSMESALRTVTKPYGGAKEEYIGPIETAEQALKLSKKEIDTMLRPANRHKAKKFIAWDRIDRKAGSARKYAVAERLLAQDSADRAVCADRASKSRLISKEARDREVAAARKKSSIEVMASPRLRKKRAPSTKDYPRKQGIVAQVRACKGSVLNIIAILQKRVDNAEATKVRFINTEFQKVRVKTPDYGRRLRQNAKKMKRMETDRHRYHRSCELQPLRWAYLGVQNWAEVTRPSIHGIPYHYGAAPCSIYGLTGTWDAFYEMASFGLSCVSPASREAALSAVKDAFPECAAWTLTDTITLDMGDGSPRRDLAEELLLLSDRGHCEGMGTVAAWARQVMHAEDSPMETLLHSLVLPIYSGLSVTGTEYTLQRIRDRLYAQNPTGGAVAQANAWIAWMEWLGHGVLALIGDLVQEMREMAVSLFPKNKTRAGKPEADMRWEGWPEKSMAALPKHNWADTTNRQLAGEVVQLVIKTMALRGAGILVSSLPGMRDVSFSTQNRYFVSMLQQLNSFALIEPSPKKNRIGPAAIFEIRSGGRTGKISQTLWTTLVATEENYPARAPAHEPILLKDPNYAIADHPFTGKDCAREVIWPILAEMVVKALSGCMPKRVRPAHFIPTEKQLVPWIRTARYHKEIRGFTPDTASWERKLAASALTPLGIDRQGCVSEEWVDPATWRRITRGRRIKVHVDSLPNVLRRIRKQARAHMRTVPLSRWPHSSGPTPKTASGTAGPESEWLKSRVNNEGSMMDALFEGIDTPEL